MVNDMTIQIPYNRSEKAYEWTCPESGEIFRFHGKGAAVKADAFRFAVSMLDPQLYETAVTRIEANPFIERMVWRAVELLINDSVEEVSPTLYMVMSSDQYGRYAVAMTEHGLTCQCRAFTDNPIITPELDTLCKHCLAVQMWRVLRADY